MSVNTGNKAILVVHPHRGSDETKATCLGADVILRRVGCEGDFERARRAIVEADGTVAAIVLDEVPIQLRLGSDQAQHRTGEMLAGAAERTPVVDGSGIRAGLERWAVILADRAQPGIFAGKRVLMVPGLNHDGLAQALGRRTQEIRYADPVVFFGIPSFPGVGSSWTLPQVAPATLGLLRNAPPEHLRPDWDEKHARRARHLFDWAAVLAGDIRVIRALAPRALRGKTVVVETAEEADLQDLRERGARMVVTLMPSLDPADALARHSAAVIEGLLAALRSDPDLPLSEDTYLDMISDLQWTPAVRYLQAGEADIHRFAFVIHPLDVGFIHRNPRLRWTRHLPDAVVEPLAALMPPRVVSKITGAVSARTGQRIEGDLIALGATPRQMMTRSPRFTYTRLNRAARIAEARGARLMGLGAFTSVIGDAGVTVGRESPIAITSGNSLTVAATLEAAKQAAVRMGTQDLSRGRAMVIGATGSIGSVCARMIALAIRNVVLVSIEPEKLIELKRLIRAETPEATITLATRSNGLVADCDLVITATSGFGQRIVDISECKPGAIICDVARPPDIGKAEAALRPDVLVVESGEVVIPGEVDYGYDLGLPPRVSYACLAETALLAMEGRFESYTLGREITVEQVKEIYRLFKVHGFRLAGLRSLGRYLTEDALVEKRDLAQRLRDDPALTREVRQEAARRLAEIPPMSKGIRAGGPRRRSGLRGSIAGGLDALSLWFARNRAKLP